MKILHVNSLYPPYSGGGAEVTLRSVATGLAARGNEVSVLTTHGGRGVLRERQDGVTVIRVPVRNLYWQLDRDSKPAWMHAAWHAIDSYNPLMARVVSRTIAGLRPDVVSAHNLPGFSCATWGAARRSGTPVVQVLHDFYALCPKSTCFRNDRVCERQCFSCAAVRLPHRAASAAVDAVIGVSSAVLEKHVEHGLFAGVKTRQVIHNAQRLPVAPPAVRPASTGLVFGYMGSLLKVKGLELLLESFETFRRHTPANATLLVAGIGDPSYVAPLQRRFEGPNVRFVGHMTPIDFFPQLDVSVVPSLWEEPLGRVVFESMHFGVPVIGAHRGGIPEMLHHEVNGLLFEPRRPGSLVEALGRVQADPALLAAMKAVARESIARFVDEDRMVDEYAELFLRVGKS